MKCIFAAPLMRGVGLWDFAHLSPCSIRITTILYEGLQEEQPSQLPQILRRMHVHARSYLLALSSSSSSSSICIAIRHWLQHGHRQNCCGSSRHDNDNRAQDTQWAPLAVQPHS